MREGMRPSYGALHTPTPYATSCHTPDKRGGQGLSGVSPRQRRPRVPLQGAPEARGVGGGGTHTASLQQGPRSMLQRHGREHSLTHPL